MAAEWPGSGNDTKRPQAVGRSDTIANMSTTMPGTRRPITTPRRIKHHAVPSILFAVLTAFAATAGTCGVANAIGHVPHVSYQLTGSAPVADYISYQSDAGQVMQAHVPLPWHTQFTGFGGEVFVISAQSPGSITCTIVVDGNVVSQATSNGAPARTVCAN
jgi:Mycobacterium membrane protein